jgi:ABC-type glycerol-3-phosphate transport system substrate-binding protein
MKKWLIVFWLLGMLLAACGPSGDGETPSPAAGPATEAAQPEQAPTVAQAPATAAPAAEAERTTVRFAVTDWDRPRYESLIRAFEEENPDLHVQVVSVNDVLELGPIGQIEYPDDAAQRLVAAADVVDVGISPETVEQGLVRDLAPLMEADPSFQADDFYPGVLERFRWQGGTWALPMTVNYRLIFYDKDAFDQAGVPYPEAGWSWDDLQAKAEALTEGEGDEVTRWGFVPAGLTYWIIRSLAGPLADYDADPPLPRFDDPAAVEAVAWYADLHREAGAMPFFEPEEGEEGGLQLPEEQVLVDQGQAAMWAEIDLSWWLRSQQRNVGVVPFPVDAPDEATTPASPSSLAMSAGTQQPQAAWRWMEYLSRQAAPPLAMGITFLPARPSAAVASGFWDDLDPSYAAALEYGIEHSYMMTPPVAYDAFEEALVAVLSGEEPAEEALAAAQERAEVEILQSATGATPVPTFVVAPAEEEPQAEGAVTVTFVPGLGSFNLEPYRALAEQFHAEHPDVVVEVKTLDFTGGTPGLQSMAASSDCFEWFPGLADPENREAILNLTPLVDADRAFTTDDYYPAVLDQFTWQGQLWGLPADITPFVFEYNKELFEAENVEEPVAGWTWDDFLGKAVALTSLDDEDQRYGFVAQVYELNDLLLVTERLGAKLLDSSTEPASFSFNDPDTVAAVRWYAALTTEHEVKPVFLTDLTNLLGASSSYLERQGLIDEGRAGMWTSSTDSILLFGVRKDPNIGVVPMPVRADGGGTGSYLAVSGYFVSAETEARQACWQWITFLNNQPGAVLGLPARRSLAESDAFRQRVGADRAAAYLAAIGDAEQPSALQAFNRDPWLGYAMFWMGQAFGQIVEGEASVEDALDAAQSQAEAYRACLIGKDDFSEESAQTCAKEVDPTLPDYLFASGG